MDGTVFFYFGGALVLAALVLSYIGIRGKDSFPPSTAALTGLTAIFAVVVIGTAAYAVANAREEQEHHDEELAEEEQEAEGLEQEAADEGAAPAAQQGEEGAKSSGEAQTLDVASPEDGSLVFDPDGLSAEAGTITLAYDNPSPIPHNINLEDEAGETLQSSDDVTGAATEISAELAPGEYVFFCSIPGHRESGMEGTLTVE